MSVSRCIVTYLIFGILSQRLAAEKCETQQTTSFKGASVKCYGFKSWYKYTPSRIVINKVSFTENQFPLVNNTFFVEFSDAKIAILRRNGIEEVESLSGLKNIEIVDLSENMITHLTRSAFRDNTKLKNVTLSLNHLQTLENDTFNDLRELEVLDLSRNLITQLHHVVFQHNVGLRTLVISHNYLKFMEADLLVNLQELQVFDVSFNVLETVNSAMFSKCLKLKTINLNSNKLKSIDIRFTNNLEHLSNFNLSSNGIREIIYEDSPESKSSDVLIDVSRDTNLHESDKEATIHPTTQIFVVQRSLTDQVTDGQQNPTTKSPIAQSSVTDRVTKGQQKNYVELVHKQNGNHGDLRDDKQVEKLKTRDEVRRHDSYEEDVTKKLSSFISTTSSPVRVPSNPFFEYALFAVLIVIILLLATYIIYPKLVNRTKLNVSICK